MYYYFDLMTVLYSSSAASFLPLSCSMIAFWTRMGASSSLSSSSPSTVALHAADGIII